MRLKKEATTSYKECYVKIRKEERKREERRGEERRGEEINLELCFTDI